MHWCEELSVVLLTDITPRALSLYKLLDFTKEIIPLDIFAHIRHHKHQLRHCQCKCAINSPDGNKYPSQAWKELKLDVCQVEWLAQPGSTQLMWLTVLIMLIRRLMIIMRPLRAAAWQAWCVCECVFVCVCVSGVCYLMVSICVRRIDKWWI